MVSGAVCQRIATCLLTAYMISGSLLGDRVRGVTAQCVTAAEVARCADLVLVKERDWIT